MKGRQPRGLCEGFSGLRFGHTWRPYQKRVLDVLEGHLDDDHLHVIAPPGSGKTVLGLEVVRRLGRPALILAPTITVREQWLERFRRDFDNGSAVELSSDLGSPGIITASTYQALAARYESGRARTLEKCLRDHGILTLVVDEAHHLRATWWKCLERLKAALEGVKVLALTATPPYDAPQAEWNRYMGFCGTVDEEIGVPELVKAGSLCPHQDYVYLSLPVGEERQTVAAFHSGVTSFVNDLGLDMELARLLGALPSLCRPGEYTDEILTHSEFYLSLAVYLNGLIPEATLPLVRELGLKGTQLPAFDRYWAQVMAEGLVDEPLEVLCPEELLEAPGSRPDRDTGDSDPGRVAEALRHRVQALRDRLQELGALERGRVRLCGTRRLSRLVRQSRSKIASIVRIVELESLQLKDALRLVILTDYIHEKELRHSEAPEAEFARLGVIPIFESVRRLRLEWVRPAVLTGRLVIVPRESEARLKQLAWQQGVPEAGLTFRELAYTREFLEVCFREGERQRSVAMVTRLFLEGDINTLVGTASLLGEGWDAPSVNTLVLASFIGSFVTSNQMRGRAIRSFEGDPFKAANIWHLACVEPGGEGGTDLALLGRRFEAFVGPTLEGGRIESGLERSGLRAGEPSEASVTEGNAAMCLRAGQRDELRQMWREALEAPLIRQRLVKELRARVPRFHAAFLQRLGGETGFSGWIWRWWSARRLAAMARAVIDALHHEGMWPREARSEVVEVEVRDGLGRVRVPEAAHVEQSRFVQVLAEVFDPLASPRYLLRRGSEYFVVPHGFGENRKRAELFQRAWRRHVGHTSLVFTRKAEGRRHLLRAKEQALLHRAENRPETRMRWV